MKCYRFNNFFFNFKLTSWNRIKYRNINLTWSNRESFTFKFNLSIVRSFRKWNDFKSIWNQILPVLSQEQKIFFCNALSQRTGSERHLLILSEIEIFSELKYIIIFHNFYRDSYSNQLEINVIFNKDNLHQWNFLYRNQTNTKEFNWFIILKTFIQQLKM